jgi:hypothetical protein
MQSAEKQERFQSTMAAHPQALHLAAMEVLDRIRQVSEANERSFVYADYNATTRKITSSRVYPASERLQTLIGQGRVARDHEFQRYIQQCDPRIQIPVYVTIGSHGNFQAGVLSTRALLGQLHKELSTLSQASRGAPRPTDQQRDEHQRACNNVECGYRGATLSRCSRCKQAWYCSAECQRRAWPAHKAYCKKAAEPEKADASPLANAATAGAAATAASTSVPPEEHTLARIEMAAAVSAAIDDMRPTLVERNALNSFNPLPPPVRERLLETVHRHPLALRSIVFYMTPQIQRAVRENRRTFIYAEFDVTQLKILSSTMYPASERHNQGIGGGRVARSPEFLQILDRMDPTLHAAVFIQLEGMSQQDKELSLPDFIAIMIDARALLDDTRPLPPSAQTIDQVLQSSNNASASS